MARIFISYRRAEAAGTFDYVYQKLTQAFGQDNVFKDTDHIPAGHSFKTVIQERLTRSSVMLVIIGPQWTMITDQDGARRLENPDDWVRTEVEVGLFLPNVTVIPVLLDDATMPTELDLPSRQLRELAGIEAVRVRHGETLEDDTKRLIETIKNLSRRWPRWWLLAAGLLLVLAVLIGFALSRPSDPPPTPSPTATATQTAAASTATASTATPLRLVVPTTAATRTLLSTRASASPSLPRTHTPHATVTLEDDVISPSDQIATIVVERARLTLTPGAVQRLSLTATHLADVMDLQDTLTPGAVRTPQTNLLATVEARLTLSPAAPAVQN